MPVVEIVLRKVKNAGITAPDIEIAVAEVEQTIKNYCNIDTVPEALKFTWANMTADLVRYEDELSDKNKDSISTDAISELKIGDTHVKLGGGGSNVSAVAASHRPNLDEIILNYTDQLNKFRRMVW